jgi:aspartate-semialdehyde dehydrogenase
MQVAVVGATGMVGRRLLGFLESRKFPWRGLRLFASDRSLGKKIEVGGQTYRCQKLVPGCFQGLDLVFFDASDEVSLHFVPQALKEGAWVVDNASVFRLEEGSFLLVPEVNGDLLRSFLKKIPVVPTVISGPNCVVVPLVMALKPLLPWGIQRVVLSTYQSTSGAGNAAMQELEAQSRSSLDQKPLVAKVFAHPIAFNCIPQIGSFQQDGATSEERKIVLETRKILERPDLKMAVTAVRVPTFFCHALSIYLECEYGLDLAEVRQALRAQPGVVVLDDPSTASYPLGISETYGAQGRDAVYVGRLRHSESSNTLQLWVVSDNLNKGAALNAIELGEMLISVLH